MLLVELVARFWEIDHATQPIARMSKEELHCEQHFNRNYTCIPSGKYSVCLPVKRDLALFGESYSQKGRLENLERKFNTNSQIKVAYSAFIKEYLDLKHMSLVPRSEVLLCKYFLSHHCVLMKTERPLS